MPRNRPGEFGNKDFPQKQHKGGHPVNKPDDKRLEKSMQKAGKVVPKSTPGKAVPPITQTPAVPSQPSGPPATVPGVPPVAPSPPSPPAAPAGPTGPTGPTGPAAAAVVPGIPPIPNVAAMLDPASHKKAEQDVTIDDAFDYGVGFKMSFLGAGQGGGNMANAFWQLGYRRVAAVNTTASDFYGLDEGIAKFDMGVGGAAKDAAFAAAQLDGREEDIWDLLTRSWGSETDYGLICVSLGGGTGSGTAPELIKIARKYLESKGQPPRVGAVVSLPGPDEGQLVCRNAVETFRKLLEIKASPIVILDNSRIDKIYKPSMKQFYNVANTTIATLFHQFNMLTEIDGSQYVFDRSEYAQLLDGGIVAMGAAGLTEEVNSPADISGAIRDQLSNNILAEVNLRRSKKGCCLFVASEAVLDRLPREYFAAGFDQLKRMVGAAYKKTDVVPVIHRGLSQGPHPGIQIYMMISELEPPITKLAALAKEAGVDTTPEGMGLASFLGVDG
jgi:cell division GTPase FtsZ